MAVNDFKLSSTLAIACVSCLRDFVLLPRRWVVERSFAWAARFRRLVRDYERLDTTLKGFHYVAFACLMIANMFKQLA